MRTLRLRARCGMCLGSFIPFAMLLSGCARSPVFNVLGSYFPGWIACMALGIIAAVLVRVVLHRRQWEARIAAVPLFYLSVALLVACACWLVAFE